MKLTELQLAKYFIFAIVIIMNIGTIDRAFQLQTIYGEIERQATMKEIEHNLLYSILLLLIMQSTVTIYHKRSETAKELKEKFNICKDKIKAIRQRLNRGRTRLSLQSMRKGF